MNNWDLSLPVYGRGEERFNWITHAVGIVFGAAALILCVLAAARTGSGRAAAAAVIYGLSMVALYSASTLYHGVSPRHALTKRILRVIDHCSVYLLIAGTYAPYALVTLYRAAPWIGITLFAVTWTGAAAGIALNLIDLKRFEKLSMTLYIALGWCALAATVPLVRNLAAGGSILLLAGGAAYTLGAVMYGAGKRRRYIHSVWHLMVLLGTALHFCSIYLYVLS